MTITAEELRKVYQAEFHREWNATNRNPTGAALLAVARYVAEKQRAVEPTEGMLKAGTYTGTHYLPETVVEGIYRAMQSVAPLVVPE